MCWRLTICTDILNDLTTKEKENLKGPRNNQPQTNTQKNTIDSGCSMLGSMIEVCRLSKMVCMMAQRLLTMHKARHKGLVGHTT